MRYLVVTITLVLGITIASPNGFSAETEASLHETLLHISQTQNSLRTLQCAFTQERSLNLFATKVRSTGRLLMVRSERLRWELYAPDDAIYWVLPDRIAYKSKSGSGQLEKGHGPFGGVLSDMLMMLEGNFVKLKDRYLVTLERRERDRILIQVVPREKTVLANTKRMEFEISTDALKQLQKVTIVERDDDRSVITFQSCVRNPSIDPTLMTGP